MTNGFTWLTIFFLLAAPLAAQTPALIAMDQEPHHHLKLQNDLVKVFDVQVAPGDSIILHRHDGDTVAIAIGEQLVTVGIPGKPDVQSKNADGQVRLQASGYVHSTRVDGTTPYHTVAVELLRPQTNSHNVCAEVLARQPQNCPMVVVKPTGASSSQPLLESDQTRVSLVQTPPHQSLRVGEAWPEVIVALDGATISGPAKGTSKVLHPGDFVWLEGGSGAARSYRNDAAGNARFIEIDLKPAK